MFEIIPIVDENSIHILCSRLSIPIEDIDVKQIQLRIGDIYEKDGIMYMPVKAVGYKIKNQSSDEELQQILERL